jgi:hypothetical protein
MLAAHMALSRENHLDFVFLIFACLRKKHNSILIFDPNHPQINFNKFQTDSNWKEMHERLQEAIPPNAPAPKGNIFILQMSVDADHAGDQLIRRSRFGFVQFINMAPIN